MRMTKSLFIGLVLATFLFAGGCEFFHVLGLPFGRRVPFNPAEQPSDIRIQRDVQFDDIPVPMAFMIRRPESFSYRSVNMRLGDFHYQGAWTYRKVESFYNRQMPLAGWEKIAEEDGKGTLITLWTKGGERCSLSLDVRDVEVKVHVRVYPEGEGERFASLR
ncbi:MAG: hypothetical protein V1918_10750 [Planctomycetota bacterium]